MILLWCLNGCIVIATRFSTNAIDAIYDSLFCLSLALMLSNYKLFGLTKFRFHRFALSLTWWIVTALVDYRPNIFEMSFIPFSMSNFTHYSTKGYYIYSVALIT